MLCSKGDRRSHKALYDGCIGYVYSVVRRYVFQEEDRQDLVQEVFARVFVNIKKYNPRRGEFKVWLRRVTVNECLMFLRNTKKMSFLAPVELKEHIATTDLVESNELERITKADIEKLLSQMPEGYRVVFMLSVIDQYDHGEISKLLGIKPETSRSQLARGRKWIRKMIINQENINAYGLF